MSKKSRNDQVSTPEFYVEEMLNRVGYTKNLIGKRVLENSCGQGNILTAIVKRYIADGREKCLTDAQLKAGLERDILGFETDPVQLEICQARLDEIVRSVGIPKVKWNILNQNFLEYKFEKIHASYVIGNPPYITYHDLAEGERENLKQYFTVCQRGRFDYCYAFIEASIRSLAKEGKMIYLIPFSIFRNRYGQLLRKYIQDYVTDIIDLSGRPIFSGITCSSAFLCCCKDKNGKMILYENPYKQIRKQLARSELGGKGEKWLFINTIENGKRFGDYFQAHNSIATLLNEAFLILPEWETKTELIVEGYAIERGACLPAASTKSQKANRGRMYIIFPYKREGNKVGKYSEEEFRKNYPEAYRYLLRFADKLAKRKADRSAQWFEYGRSQALNEMWKSKLILSMVVTKQAGVYYADEQTVPYAGYFVTRKEGAGFTLEQAAKILQSESFYQYVKEVGTPTTETSYRISVRDIMDYRFK